MKTYKKILFLLCQGMLFYLGMEAQDAKWKSYLAYQNATQVEVTPNYVFGVYDGALLSYDIEDGEVRTYSPENGLSDINIACIKYHPDLKCLVIVYENANIDLYFGQDDITNIASLKDKDIPNKIINTIDLIDNYAYLSGAFGVVVLDVNKREVKYTFNWDLNVRSVCYWNGYLYASTERGLWYADPSVNLQDMQNWKERNLPFSNTSMNQQIEQLLVFNNQLVCNTANKAVWKVERVGETYTVQQLYSSAYKTMTLLNGQWVVVLNNQIHFHTDFTRKTTLSIAVSDIASAKEGNFWLAKNLEGLVGITKDREANQYTVSNQGIQVNSPVRNLIYNLTMSEDQLLVTGGGWSSDRFWTPGTFMVYDNKQWYNLDANAMTAAIQLQTGNAGMRCLDLISAIADPADPNHYYVTSWGEGVYELRRNGSEFKLVKLHTYTNTNALQTTSPLSANALNFVRVDGLVYDKNHRLYMVNGGVANSLVVLDNNNVWKSFSDPNLSLAYPNRLMIARNNLKWGNILRPTAKAGVYVYNDGNTLDNVNDDEVFYASSFTDQTGRNVSATAYTCLAEDLNGLVWVGTDNGPIYFSAATNVRDKICGRLIRPEESNTAVGLFILEGMKITSIAVDRLNRKWLGTNNNGLFVIDQSDGKPVVGNYTTENSSILSNNVTALAINQKKGEIFIGTDRGLCSYQEEALGSNTDYSNVYAYPNPVYPLRKNEVIITGLMNESTVKITDVAGNLIKEGTSSGGQYVWDCSDVNREIVKSGIYLVFASASDGSQGVVTKIMVIQ